MLLNCLRTHTTAGFPFVDLHLCQPCILLVGKYFLDFCLPSLFTGTDFIENSLEFHRVFRQTNHKKLKEEISRTWGYLHYVESEKMLVDSLLMQPDDTKVAIMHAVTRMATGKSLHVLEDEYKEAVNPHVRFEALRCIYNYGDEGLARFHELEAEKTKDEEKYFSFFNNPITLAKIRLDKEQAYHPSVETVYI